MQSENKKNGRGGARPGAGRKKKPEGFVSVSMRLSPSAKDKLFAYAKAKGVSAQEALRDIIESLEF
jgi:hypothetical protein